MSKAITLLSGGLDSFVSTHIARKKHKIVLALTFDYNQRAAKREVSAAGKMCALWKIPHKIIRLPWLGEITDTALVNRGKMLPTVCHPEGIRPSRMTEGSPALNSGDSSSATGGLRMTTRATARAVWVPNRNGLFINIAAAFAESLGADFIVTGFNKEEAVAFPDNSSLFVKAANDALKFSTLNKPQVISFTQKMAKSDMVNYANRNKLPLELCWPCYEGGKKLCGKCESCVRFLSACHGAKGLKVL